jgi:predicted aconitase
VKLTGEERKMLHGGYGPGTAMAMDIVVKWGEAYDAERLVDVTHTHTAPTEPLEWLKKISEGAKARTYSTMHPFPFDLKRWKKMGVKQEYADKVITNYNEQFFPIYKRLGLIPVYTCCPYMVGNVPPIGSYVNFHGSEVVLLANSLFGARNPRVGGAGPILSAITGKEPYCDLVVDENRYGEVLFEPDPSIRSEEFTNADLGAFGYYVGMIGQERVCVVNNLRKELNFESFKYLTTPMSVSGAVGICHIVGFTPEAQTLRMAFGNKKPKEKVVVGRKEMRQMWRQLNTTDSQDVDLVVLGCPHFSIPEMQELASMLEGRKIKEGKRVWIALGEETLAVATRMGLTEVIERSGTTILTGVCPGAVTPWHELEQKPKVVATNSVKNAHYTYVGSGKTIDVRYGSTKDCIDSVLAGRFNDTGRWPS